MYIMCNTKRLSTIHAHPRPRVFLVPRREAKGTLKIDEPVMSIMIPSLLLLVKVTLALIHSILALNHSVLALIHSRLFLLESHGSCSSWKVTAKFANLLSVDSRVLDGGGLDLMMRGGVRVGVLAFALRFAFFGVVDFDGNGSPKAFARNFTTVSLFAQNLFLIFLSIVLSS